MKKPPLSLKILAWLFIATGLIALAAGLRSTDAVGLRSSDFWVVDAVRLAAIVGGAFLLRGDNWARWLLVLWTAFHLVISVLDSPLKLVVHSVIFAVVAYLLFRPAASVYFRRAPLENAG